MKNYFEVLFLSQIFDTNVKNNFINFLLTKKSIVLVIQSLIQCMQNFLSKYDLRFLWVTGRGVLRDGKDSSSVRSDYHKISEDLYSYLFILQKDFLNSISYNGPYGRKLIFENELPLNPSFIFFKLCQKKYHQQLLIVGKSYL